MNPIETLQRDVARLKDLVDGMVYRNSEYARKVGELQGVNDVLKWRIEQLEKQLTKRQETTND